MNNDDKSYSREFRAKVVLEAVSGENVNPLEIAEKHDVSADQILAWAHEMNISDVKLKKLSEEADQEDMTATVELRTSDSDFAAELDFGATFDNLDLKMLAYWSLFGSAFIGLIIFALVVIFNFSTASTVQSVAEQSDFYDIRVLKQNEQETLSSFGVVDLEEGIYRAPIDSVISRMAQD